MSADATPLARLCRAAGVATAWHDAWGRRYEPPDEALRAVLCALGHPTGGPAGDADALVALERVRASRAIEPVLLARPGEPITVRVRAAAGSPVVLEVLGDDDPHGAVLAASSGRASTDGGTFDARLAPLETGRYAVRAGTGQRSTASTLLVAPPGTWRPGDGEPTRAAGLFAPVFALRRRAGAPGGTLSDLAALVDHAAGRGIGSVATLPLLPLFDGETSPYAPISRAFWNERLLDPRTLPGAEGDDVDPLALAERFFAAGDDPSYRAWLARTPRAAAYARFRARTGRGRAGAAVAPADRLARAHLFLQWAADREIARIAERAARAGPGLALDLPVGSHPDGFDRHDAPEIHADGVSAGAPPDALFALGQDWGLPPLIPCASREDGHRAFAVALRHHARHAGLVRIDHIMGLHRLFLVPRGFEARQGTYVRYPADELWAAVSIESHRQRCEIVGEDLGTVPDEVRETLAARGALRTWVALFELGPVAEGAAPPGPPAGCVASLTTHDTPSFAGFVRGRDIDLRVRLGSLDADGAEAERTARRALVTRLREALLGSAARADDRALLLALLAHLAASPARLVTVALDDLLLVGDPVNVPGTTTEHENWAPRHGRGLDEIFADPAVLEALDALRR